MINDYMREIAKQETFSRQDIEILMCNLVDHIQISHLIALQHGSDASPFPEDNESALNNSVVLTREALFEFNEMLFPPCEVELARRKQKLEKLQKSRGFR